MVIESESWGLLHVTCSDLLLPVGSQFATAERWEVKDRGRAAGVTAVAAS